MDRGQKDEGMGGKDTAFGWSSSKADKESKMSCSNWATEKVDEEILAAERALKEKALNRAKETPKKNDVAEVVLDDSEPPSAKEVNKEPQQTKENRPTEKKKEESTKPKSDGEVDVEKVCEDLT